MKSSALADSVDGVVSIMFIISFIQERFNFVNQLDVSILSINLMFQFCRST